MPVVFAYNEEYGIRARAAAWFLRVLRVRNLAIYIMCISIIGLMLVTKQQLRAYYPYIMGAVVIPEFVATMTNMYLYPPQHYNNRLSFRTLILYSVIFWIVAMKMNS